jgi:hypothetical protein
MKVHAFGSLPPVSTLTLGGGGLGMLWRPTTFDECVATVREAVAAGVNLFDLAPRYGDGKAEEVVGAAFAGRLPAGIRVTSKCNLSEQPSDKIEMSPGVQSRDDTPFAADMTSATGQRSAATSRTRRCSRIVSVEIAEFFAPFGKDEQRDRFRRQQRGADDQRLCGRVELRRFLDGEGEGLRYRQLVMVFGPCIALGVEHLRRRRREALTIVGDRDFEPLAIGGRLLMGERQAAQCLRQGLGRFALPAATGPRSNNRRRSPLARDGFRRARRRRARHAHSR